MKRAIFFGILLLSQFTILGANIAISGLPENTTPSTNTFLEIADIAAATKSDKVLLQNLMRYGIGDSTSIIWAIQSGFLKGYATNLVDNQISASAAITRSKIAAGTASQIVINDGSGNLTSEATLGAARFPALTGDTTTSAGSLATTTASATGNWAFKGVISPSQLTASQNDYSPTSLGTSTILRLNSDASRNITGLQTANTAGDVKILWNVGSNPIVLVNQSASSQATNRFLLGADLTLGADTSVRLVYDTTTQRWRSGSYFGGTTGTGKLVLDAAPTLSGHPTIEGITATGATGSGKFVFDTAPTLSGTATITQIDMGNTDASITRHGAGDIDIEGNLVYRAGGTDVPPTDGGTGLSSGTSGGVLYFSGSTTIASSAALAASAVVLGGGAGVAPATTTTGSGVVTAIGNTVNSAGGFLTTDGTATLTGKTYDASATGNVLKWTDYDKFIAPSYADEAGAIITTNNAASALSGHATFSGSGATNANWVVYEWVVPDDIDTAVDLKVARFKFTTAGTSTSAATFNIGMQDIADSADQTTISLANFSNWISMSTGTLTSAAANDGFTISAQTLTSWRSNITAGHTLHIMICRDGATDSNNDALTDKFFVIQYGRTQ